MKLNKYLVAYFVFAGVFCAPVFLYKSFKICNEFGHYLVKSVYEKMHTDEVKKNKT